MASVQRATPSTPRVISPSPTPSDTSNKDNYFGPVTRSSTRKITPRMSSPAIEENDEASSSSSEGRARSRSRSRDDKLRRRRMSGLAPMSTAETSKSSNGTATKKAAANLSTTPSKPTTTVQVNGHLSPATLAKNYWRELSRSPSPLGLIPIHRHWRSFVHKHEIPRKLLHVSIGFVTLVLYASGSQSESVHPALLAALIPIALTDVLRHNVPSVNRFYVRVLGAFMRESEAHDRYNGVIWYLLGAWAVLRYAPKDVGVVSVCVLSWCDTAASTFGRLWGKYTPRLARGKSLAGSIAAFIFGVGTSILFWGFVAPYCERNGLADDTGINAFAYQGSLALPASLSNSLGLTTKQAVLSGSLALIVMSLFTGLIASISEAIDIWDFDDNVTIPVLCGIGLWGFLKLFGSA